MCVCVEFDQQGLEKELGKETNMHALAVHVRKHV